MNSCPTSCAKSGCAAVSDSRRQMADRDSLCCSFCHKTQGAAAKLISSPSDYPRAYICDECVQTCMTIIEDDRANVDDTTHAAEDAWRSGSLKNLSAARHPSNSADCEMSRRACLQFNVHKLTLLLMSGQRFAESACI